MKVKLTVCMHKEIEVEIDDKFRKLAVARPWDHPEITDEDTQECLEALEAASGLPFGDEVEAGEDYPQAFIVLAVSAENGETMLEN